MVGKHLPRSPPFKALTVLLDAIASSRWRCRYTNFYQLCDTTGLVVASPFKVGLEFSVGVTTTVFEHRVQGISKV
jgi:hypothetical protein